MKKWKIINKISIIMLFVTLVVILYRLIEAIVYNVNGWYLAIPGPALFKWYEIFLFNLYGDFMYVAPIFIIGILLFVITKRKLKTN